MLRLQQIEAMELEHARTHCGAAVKKINSPNTRRPLLTCGAVHGRRARPAGRPAASGEILSYIITDR